MPAVQRDLEISKLQTTILSWLKKRLYADNFAKLNDAFESIRRDAEDWEVFSLFSRVSRYSGKDPLDLSVEEKSVAQSLRNGWEPGHWTTDELARALLLLGLAEREKEEFFEKLDKLFVSADLAENTALYKSLPILPYPDDLTDRGAEGIRTNITDVFNAVALRNPFPADFFNDDAWNQVILKSLFVGSPVYLIQGVDDRRNETLARTLVEYAHERWSAGREVSPELWRSIGPFIDESIAADIKKEVTHDEKVHRQAAVLALKESSSEAASNILDKYPDAVKEAESENMTWEKVGRAVHKSNI
jgi:hypothetical protein